ncbi:MAG: TrkH family potassium uptake protein [Candidatus Nanoarchaeia archaeon]
MRQVLRYLGYILLISIIFQVIPITTALFYGEAISGFLIAGTASLVAGLALISIPKEERKKGLTLQEGLILTALSFLIIPLFSSISFLPVMEYDTTNALFESYSGFTTTGLTVMESFGSVPKSILLWRAEQQWIGGLGIVVVFLFILSKVHGKDSKERGKSMSTLYQAQGFKEHLEPTIRESMTRIILIYLAYSILGTILLFVTGMTFINSIGMMFTSISTGGFSMSDTLATNNLQLGILSFLMIIGSMSFLIHNTLFKRKFKALIQNVQIKLFLVLLSIFAGISFVVLPEFKTVLFHSISALTTTGYAFQPIASFPALMIVCITISMIIGGSIGSTSGGIKLSRILIILKAVPWVIKKLSYPIRAVIPMKIEGKPVSEYNVTMTEVFISTYVLGIIIGTIAFMLLGFSFRDSAFQIASALGTVGLQTISLVTIPLIGKLILIMFMILGRLEIFPVFVLIRRLIKGS